MIGGDDGCARPVSGRVPRTVKDVLPGNLKRLETFGLAGVSFSVSFLPARFADNVSLCLLEV